MRVWLVVALIGAVWLVFSMFQPRRSTKRRKPKKRRSRGSAYNSRGDFDPPGGWGAMGPGE
jgi:hypothetical protein